jgi:hypothetical protein
MNLRWLSLLLALAVTAWLSVGGQEGAADAVSEAVVRPVTARSASSTPAGAQRREVEAGLLRLHVRQEPDPLGDAERLAELAEKEQPIFHSQTWDPPPVKVVAKVDPPRAPAWPYAYLGQQLAQGEWWVYLTLGEETRAVKKGQILDQNYRIEKIEPPNMSVTYLPLSEAQTVTIGAMK